MGVPVVIGGKNLLFPVGIGLTDLPNIGGGGHHCNKVLKFTCIETE